MHQSFVTMAACPQPLSRAGLSRVRDGRANECAVFLTYNAIVPMAIVCGDLGNAPRQTWQCNVITE